MPKSAKKKGKTEKERKVESKSKPKSAVKIKKTVAKVKKVVVKAKPAPKKAVKTTSKTAPKKSSSSPKVVVKTKVVVKGPKKVVKKEPVSKKAPAKKVTPSALKNIKVTVPKTLKAMNQKDKKIVPTTNGIKKNTGNFELGVVLRTGRRPEAIINKKKLDTDIMGEEKLRYSEEELKEFEVLILDKLEKAKKELVYMKEMLSKKNDQGTDNTGGTMKLLEDGADTLEKENFSQLAVRQQKFVTQLENAVARIKNGSYGVCIDTGKLIPKERLKAVPHTQHSIEAKLNRR